MNEAIAVFARWALSGDRWMSSNTTTKSRPRSAGAVRFDTTRGRSGTAEGALAACGFTWSKVVICWGFPSSSDGEVVAGEAGDGLALAVDHHHVDRDLLDAGREHLGRSRGGAGACAARLPADSASAATAAAARRTERHSVTVNDAARVSDDFPSLTDTFSV